MLIKSLNLIIVYKCIVKIKGDLNFIRKYNDTFEAESWFDFGLKILDFNLYI